MKILVTGATGFVGSHLCDFLTSSGHEVFSLARSTKKFDTYNIKGTLIEGKLSSKKYNQWIDQLPNDLDAVVHIAGLTHSLNIKNFYKVNTKNTQKIIDDLATRYTKLKFILISSLAAQGPSKKDCPLDETMPARPVSHYGQSKYQAEVALEEHAPVGWKKVIIRPPMVIGPKDPAFLEIFKMVKKGFMLYPGKNGGNKEYTFISIFDLCKVISKSIEYNPDKPSAEIFLPGYPAPIKYNDIVKEVVKLLSKDQVIIIHIPLFIILIITKILQLIQILFRKFDSQLTPDKINEIKPNFWVCDSSKSQNKLNLSYKWDLESTLKETYESYIDLKWL